ncbi:MAG: hypothetical protein JWM08_1163, partial [Candidatus Angelobacter sp.]|nr:hypothetical protein [Candidatus Angelobacter sp.]
DVAAVRIGARREVSFKSEIGLAIVQAGNAIVSRFNLHQHRRQIAVRSRASHQGNIRRFLEDLFTFLLRHTAQHAEFLTLLLKLLVVVKPVEDFLFRFVADGASVVKHKVGFFYRLDLAVSLMHQCANDFLGVMHIHLATKCFQVKRLFLLCAHGSSITQQNSSVCGYS